MRWVRGNWLREVTDTNGIFTTAQGERIKKAADHPDAITQKFSGQITAFNNIGEVTDTSNTIAINGNFQAAFEDASPGFLFTHLTYDSLGRLEEVMKPDNNHVDYDREGCGCAGNMTTRVTDELGVVTETKTDFLGRLKEAKEPISSWQDYSRAEYTYNELDQLIRINHFGSSSLSQVRWFNYDGYGRLYSEYTPEGGVVSYSYKDNDQLATKTDARNITTSYTYNTHGLMTGMAHSDSTSSSSFDYDSYGARTFAGNNEEQAFYGYNSYRQLTTESHFWVGLTFNKFCKCPPSAPMRLSSAVVFLLFLLPVFRAGSLPLYSVGQNTFTERGFELCQPQPLKLYCVRGWFQHSV